MLRRTLRRFWRLLRRDLHHDEAHVRDAQEMDKRIQDAEARLRMLQWETDVVRRTPPKDQG